MTRTGELIPREEEIEILKRMRAHHVSQVNKWRARGDEEKERAAFRECEAINARLTELDYFDVAVEVVVELPGIEVEG